MPHTWECTSFLVSAQMPNTFIRVLATLFLHIEHCAVDSCAAISIALLNVNVALMNNKVSCNAI